jgi:cytochrome c peroxidase
MRTGFLIKLLLIGTLGTAMLVNGCRKDQFQTTPIELPIPVGFPQKTPIFENNPLTEEGFQLGRKLFYDGILSKDGNFPCASCHQQFAAFATFDHSLSHGFDNSFTARNAPGLFNLAWHQQFHWDGGITHLEVQPLAPLTAPNEMAEDLNNVLEKLRNHPQYPGMFERAFGSKDIDSKRMLQAITQFVGSMVSAEAKYDQVRKGNAQFTAAETRGYLIFNSQCASCHSEPLFTDLSYRNVGIPLNPFNKDFGRMTVTGNRQDSLKFKVPTLRNLSYTFPYGHDGRFISIDRVLDHYERGIQAGPTLDPSMRNGIELSPTQRADLKEFLKTLDDPAFLQNKRFGPPE